MAGRRTNLALLVMLVAAVATGAAGFAIGTGWNRWPIVAHGVVAAPSPSESNGPGIVGKTNSPVMGFRGTCDNYVFGPSRNPFDTSKNTGGSSGGSTAAVADGLVPLAEGTDAGWLDSHSGVVVCRPPVAWDHLEVSPRQGGEVPRPMTPGSSAGHRWAHPVATTGQIY